jgi:hypothetical protein
MNLDVLAPSGEKKATNNKFQPRIENNRNELIFKKGFDCHTLMVCVVIAVCCKRLFTQVLVN